MNIAQELSIVRDNIAEYGMTNITQLEYDAIYQQGRADAVDEIDAFIKSFPSLLCHTTVIEEWERYKEQLKEQNNGRNN